MNSKIIVLLIMMSALILCGCQNMAAERLAEDCWEFRENLILGNSNFTANERELFIIEIMQANGFSDDEIVDEIENLQTKRSEEE